MKIVCPHCEEIIDLNVLSLMEDGLTRCSMCRGQIIREDLPPDIFEDMESSKKGGHKSATDLLTNEFEL